MLAFKKKKKIPCLTLYSFLKPPEVLSHFHKRGKPRSIQFLHPAPSLEGDFLSIPLFQEDSITVLLTHWTREYV